jgi:protein SCO1/2
MMKAAKTKLCWPVVAMLLMASSLCAQQVTAPTGDLAKIDIVEHLGSKIPLDLKFTDESGVVVTLADYFGKGKPVLLSLGYYDCPMLCNLVFNAEADGVRGLQWAPGDKFTMLTVSIKPSETPQLAYAKKQNYLKYLNRADGKGDWTFLVGEESQSKALADAIGFKYVYDESTKEYGHAAATYVLTEDGVISRYLYGIEFPTKDLKFALLEASQGKIGSTIDRLLLFCYHYDPASKGYVLAAVNIMKIGGGMTAISLGIFILALLRRERKLRRMTAEQLAHNRTAIRNA